jgi:hypothetical protein
MTTKGNKIMFHDIGRSPEAANFLASQLERLMALPLTTPAEVEIWYKECAVVQRALDERFPNFEPFHEVWHFSMMPTFADVIAVTATASTGSCRIMPTTFTLMDERAIESIVAHFTYNARPQSKHPGDHSKAP